MQDSKAGLRVLVADDSVVVRKALKQSLSSLDGVCEVSVASSGRFALDKLRQTTVDLLVVELNISQADGLEILKTISQEHMATKCIILVGDNANNAVRGIQAMRLGAIDVLPLPTLEGLSEAIVHERLGTLLGPRIKRYLGDISKAVPPLRQVQAAPLEYPSGFKSIDLRNFKPQVVVIASSTGGPDALDRVLKLVKSNFKLPILIAQHMPAYFTASLAQRLGEVTGLPAAEGQHGETVKGGHIYVAPGNYHMSVVRKDGVVTIVLDQSAPVLHVRPAANNLMNSVALVYPGQALGIVLTGMGEDGTEGAVSLKRSGSAVIIQDQASSVVWGMPGSVYEARAYDRIGDPNILSQTLVNCCA